MTDAAASRKHHRGDIAEPPGDRPSSIGASIGRNAALFGSPETIVQYSTMLLC